MWLLIVGLVVGAGLVWLVMLDSRRRESDIDAVELPREAAWLSAVLAEDGYEVSPDAAEQLLLLHRAYVGAPPPDPVETPDEGRDEIAFGGAPARVVAAPLDDLADASRPDSAGSEERSEAAAEHRVRVDG